MSQELVPFYPCPTPLSSVSTAQIQTEIPRPKTLEELLEEFERAKRKYDQEEKQRKEMFKERYKDIKRQDKWISYQRRKKPQSTGQDTEPIEISESSESSGDDDRSIAQMMARARTKEASRNPLATILPDSPSKGLDPKDITSTDVQPSTKAVAQKLDEEARKALRMKMREELSRITPIFKTQEEKVKFLRAHGHRQFSIDHMSSTTLDREVYRLFESLSKEKAEMFKLKQFLQEHGFKSKSIARMKLSTLQKHADAIRKASLEQRIQKAVLETEGQSQGQASSEPTADINVQVQEWQDLLIKYGGLSQEDVRRFSPDELREKAEILKISLEVEPPPQEPTVQPSHQREGSLNDSSSTSSPDPPKAKKQMKKRKGKQIIESSSESEEPAPKKKKLSPENFNQEDFERYFSQRKVLPFSLQPFKKAVFKQGDLFLIREGRSPICLGEAQDIGLLVPKDVVALSNSHVEIDEKDKPDMVSYRNYMKLYLSRLRMKERFEKARRGRGRGRGRG